MKNILLILLSLIMSVFSTSAFSKTLNGLVMSDGFYYIPSVAAQTVTEGLINESCMSKSSDSIYDISFNTSQRVGEIRYRYMGQDVFYSANITSIEGSKIRGIAEFKDSRSGEVRGSSWIFIYNTAKKILWDNDLPRYCK